MAVHLTSTDFGFEREIVADRAGDFLVLRLPPGEYQLRATSAAPGLGTAVATVDLEGGDLAEVELLLGQRGASQRGPASTGGGDGPSLTLANYVIAGQMSALPLASRRWEDLAALDSEANETASSTDAGDTMGDDPDDPASRMRGSDGGTAAGLSYAGLSGIESTLSIDGLSGQQSFRAGPRGAASGGASSRSSYNQGSVRSFRILPHNFSAQYGMVGGLAMVSRAASAQLHGDAFVRLRESAWAATNPFSIETHYRDGAITSAPVKPGGVMMLFGGSVGLPLTRRDVSAPGRPAPQRNERQPVSLFASLEAQLRNDRIVSSPSPANFFDLSAGQIALLANRGVGAAATKAALNYLDSLTGTTVRHAYRVQGSVRVDAAPTARDRMTLIYAGNRFDSPAGAALGQSSDAVVARGTGSLGDSVVHVDVGSARWLHLFSHSLNNELRTQVAHDLNYETPHAPLAQEPSIGPGGYAPQVSIAPNGFSYGTPTSMGGAATGGHRAYPDELRLELADSAELHLGRHLLIAGGDWSRIDDHIDVLSGTEGAFSYDSGITKGKAGGLVDWITDYTFNVHAYPNGGCRDRR